MDYRRVQEILFKNEQYAKAYDEMSLSFEIAKIVIQARASRNITQKELAEKVRTGQSSISRLESGESLPSLSFIDKIAKALDMILLPPLLISKEEVEYCVNSDSDLSQIKISMLESRRSLVSSIIPSIAGPSNSANSQIDVIGGIV